MHICTGVTNKLYLLLNGGESVQSDTNFELVRFNCSSSMCNSFSFSPRLEVQADVQKERYSLSGESGTVSLGTVSDNASTKAMAGSILNSYIPLDR